MILKIWLPLLIASFRDFDDDDECVKRREKKKRRKKNAEKTVSTSIDDNSAVFNDVH